MEQAKGYEKKLIQLKQALNTFEKSINIDISTFSDIEQDTIRSGQVQKFEVSVELFWKTGKKFLYEVHGVEAISPKMVIKEFFLTKYTNEKHFEALIEMINDRNRLSHVYNEEQFNEIYFRLTEYFVLMNGIVKKIG